MHPFATDSNERQQIIVVLACLSVACAYGLDMFFKARQITAPWYVDVPSVFGFFGTLYWAFDNVIWKVPLLHRLGLVKVPNLGGQWSGELRTSFDQLAQTHAVDVTIAQTWTRIGVAVQTPHSSSCSHIGGIVVGSVGGPVLTYEYANEPNPQARSTMQAHRGVARLTYREQSGVALLEGEYYSGRGRANQGTLRLERKSKLASPVLMITLSKELMARETTSERHAQSGHGSSGRTDG